MSSPLRSPYSITSVQAPGPAFFRSHRTRQLSSSSFSSLDPSASSCSEESSSSGSSSSDEEGDEFGSISSLGRTAGAGRRSLSRAEANALNRSQQSQTARSPSLNSLQTHRRVHLKLSFLILRARQALSSEGFEPLAMALKQLATSLPGDLRALGAFLPILDRLAADLRVELAGEGRGKEFRRGLTKDEAKALTSLRQRWTATGGASEKGKMKLSSEVEWVEAVRAIVNERALPSCLSPPFDKPTSTLLGALESLLMPSSLPRISLSGLNLTSAYLSSWSALERSDDVLKWYLSFDRDPSDPRDILSNVRSLDLSRNRISDFPSWLPTVFPGLETLSVAHCAFRFLPPGITLLHQLRRLKSHGNQLSRGHSRRGGVKHNAKEIVRHIRATNGQGYESDVESLAVTCAQVFRRTRLAATSQALPESGQESADEVFAVDELALKETRTRDPLPPHIERLVNESYACCSCAKFVPATSSSFLPALFERVHHLDPGVALPAKLPGAVEEAPPHFSSMVRPTTPTLSSGAGATIPPIPTTTASVFSPSPPLSPLPSPSPSPQASASSRPPPHRLTLEEKVLLLLLGRGLDLTTFVIGDEVGYRFCLRCARDHLGIEGGRECACGVCAAERGREGGEGGVMRWLRRKPGRARP